MAVQVFGQVIDPEDQSHLYPREAHPDDESPDVHTGLLHKTLGSLGTGAAVVRGAGGLTCEFAGWVAARTTCLVGRLCTSADSWNQYDGYLRVIRGEVACPDGLNPPCQAVAATGPARALAAADAG